MIFVSIAGCRNYELQRNDLAAPGTARAKPIATCHMHANVVPIRFGMHERFSPYLFVTPCPLSSSP